MSFFVRVNGENRECPEGSTVDTLLAQLQLDPATVLVELNRNVLAKEALSTASLKAADCVEIIQFVRGG